MLTPYIRNIFRKTIHNALKICKQSFCPKRRDYAQKYLNTGDI